MNRFIRNAVVMGVVFFGIMAAVESRRVAAADENQAVMAADAAFLQAAAQGDKAALEKLLDPDFFLVDTDANQYNRAEVLQNLPRVANADVAPTVKMYGQAGVVKAIRGQAHVMRVWVKRPAGWRALVYQEVTLGSQPPRPPLPPGASTDCDNPCKHYPYTPKNETEKQVLDAMHGVIMGLAYYDIDAYVQSTADDFEMTMSVSPKVVTKAERLKGFARQKAAGDPPAINDPTTYAQMYDFDGAVFLIAKWVTRSGQHDVDTRLFVPRNGRWVLQFGFETMGYCKQCGT
jgi:hypothetical protein